MEIEELQGRVAFLSDFEKERYGSLLLLITSLSSFFSAFSYGCETYTNDFKIFVGLINFFLSFFNRLKQLLAEQKFQAQIAQETSKSQFTLDDHNEVDE